eukprot:4169974-Pleurochrysis_carterae.AAC.1
MSQQVCGYFRKKVNSSCSRSQMPHSALKPHARAYQYALVHYESMTMRVGEVQHGGYFCRSTPGAFLNNLSSCPAELCYVQNVQT